MREGLHPWRWCTGTLGSSALTLGSTGTSGPRSLGMHVAVVALRRDIAAVRSHSLLALCRD